MARISIFCDVKTKMVLSECIKPYTSSEKEQFHLHEHNIETDDIVLMDAYYAKASIIHSIKDKNADFVVPLTDQRHVVRRFLNNKSRKDICLEIVFKDSKTEEIYPVYGRLVKKKIHGKNKALFTSLTDVTTYSIKDIFNLYDKRWGVEVSYLHLKNKLELANWTGTSVLAVKQDFKAKILLYNLTCALSFDIKPKRRKVDRRRKSTKRKRVINFSNAITQCRSVLIKICKKISIDKVVKLFVNKTRANVEYSKQGQSWPRKHWIGKKYHMNQKTA